LAVAHLIRFYTNVLLETRKEKGRLTQDHT